MCVCVCVCVCVCACVYVWMCLCVHTHRAVCKINGVGARDSIKKMHKMKGEWKMAKIALIVILLYVFSWAPYSCVALTAFAGYSAATCVCVCVCVCVSRCISVHVYGFCMRVCECMRGRLNAVLLL